MRPIHPLLILLALSSLTLSNGDGETTTGNYILSNCEQLPFFQVQCEETKIDPDTGEAKFCRPDRRVAVNCTVLPQIDCIGNRTFFVEKACRYTNGYYHSTALALSIFLGNFGIDRFYLGYPAIGLLKLSTFGFFVFGNVLDICLIATQSLLPADGSDYIVGPNGSHRTKFWSTMDTFHRQE